MNLTKGIKKLMLERSVKNRDLSALIGLSESNFSKYLVKKDFRVHEDLEKVANALDYDVKVIFVDRRTGKEIECDD